MKYFKASICSLATFASFSYIQSAENDNPDLWGELRKKYDAMEDLDISRDKRAELIDQGFSVIVSQYCTSSTDFLEPLKEFYKQVGNYGFPMYILSPINGLKSDLSAATMKGRSKGISEDWLAFTKMTGYEYFFINYKTGEITRFDIEPEIKHHETYPNLSAWINRLLLNKR